MLATSFIALTGRLIGVLKRPTWILRGWNVVDTYRPKNETGVKLICSNNHEYWERTLPLAEKELYDAITDCPKCNQARRWFVFS